MTSDLIKRLREARNNRGAFVLQGPAYLMRLCDEAATALERGVWKPEEEAIARIIDPKIWDDRAQTLLAYDLDNFNDFPWPYSGQQAIDLSLAKARDILALPSQAST